MWERQKLLLKELPQLNFLLQGSTLHRMAWQTKQQILESGINKQELILNNY